MSDAAEVLKDADERGLRRALIVTALPLERDAVRAHLTDLGVCVGDDDELYECYEYRCGGKIGDFTAQGWLVIVAECGAGTHVAQSAVMYANQMFKPFEVILFIGIAASRKKDIVIGSVIASDRIYYPLVGKYENGQFHNRPRQHNVGGPLKLIATQVIREGGWTSRILPLRGGAVPSEEKYPKPFPPTAKLAAIVTVEAVSADLLSELEKNIDEHYQDAHALEMEGYGAALAAEKAKTPIIVIRGISDMRAGKNPEDDAVFQPVAAMHAAAFGIRLLDQWSESQQPFPMKAMPAVHEPTIAIPAAGPAAAQRTVFNLDGAPEDYTPEEIEKIVQTLRDKTGNPNLKVVGLEKGSIRLIIEGADDLTNVDQSALRTALATEHDVALMGTVSEQSYRDIQALEKRLPVVSQDLLTWPRTLPGGTWISRPEVDVLLADLAGRESSTTVLLGEPGSGKSAFLAEVGLRLADKGWPVLAIKADLLPTSVQSDVDLGRAIGLDGGVGETISLVASLRPVVLLIDQLDALASYVDLDTGRLNVLLNLVRRLSHHHNIHIVLSARTFEFEHDVRLRAVQADKLVLELPAWPDVLAILAQHSVVADGWPLDAQQEMRRPQALATYLKLLPLTGAQPFTTYQAMLDMMWRTQILAHARGNQLDALISEIAQRMAEDEVLWLAEVRFDDRADDIKALKALGVLVSHGVGSIGFSHQTLFEHALARSFARGDGALSRFVLERESSLFLRPKLWAALNYLRAVEAPAYRKQIETIWNQPTLRVHLRQLVIEFLGQQVAPFDHEELIMTQALGTDRDRPIALNAIVGSAGWFDRLGRQFVEPAMVRDSDIGIASGILTRAWAFASDRVLAMIQSKWVGDPQFDRICLRVLQDCPHWTREIADIAVAVVKRTMIAPFELDYLVATIGVDHPDFAMLLVMAKLDHDLDAAIAESSRRLELPRPPAEDLEAAMAWRFANSPSDPLTRIVDDTRDWDSLEALAEKAPEVVLAAFWPWFVRLLTAVRTANPERDWTPGFPIPYGLDLRFEGERSFGLQETTLLGALRIALEQFAQNDPDAFLNWLDTHEQERANPAQRYFAHTLASLPERFSSRSLKFLQDDPNRLFLGNSEDHSSTSKRLIKAASAFWTDDELARFETFLLSYVHPQDPDHIPPPDVRRMISRLVRRTRLGLLRVLPEKRLSPTSLKVIVEEGRVFEKDHVGVTYSGVQSIGSPISEQAFSLSRDEDLINAFKKIPDASGWNHPTRWMSGGNVQLSREFATFAETNPERAFRVLQKFEPSFGTRAAGYALDALSKSAEPDLMVTAILDLAARGFDGEEYRGSIARAIDALSHRDVMIGDDIIDLLKHWLATPAPRDADDTNDDKPNVVDDLPDTLEGNEEGLAPKEAEEDEAGDGRSILWGNSGMTLVPHGSFPILDCLMNILLKRKDSDGLLDILNGQVEAGDSLEVWKALTYRFIYLHPTSDEAFATFLTRVFGQYPQLSGTREAAFLLGHVQWRLPDFVRERLAACRDATNGIVQQYYGELIALVAIVQPNLEWASAALDEILQPGIPSAKILGVVHAAANLWADEKVRDRANCTLIATMPLADSNGWFAIVDIFRSSEELVADTTTVTMLESLAKHMPRDIQIDPVFLVPALASLLPNNATLVAEIAQILVDAQSAKLADIRTGHAAIVPEMIDLAITLHRSGETTREAGTTLFEALMLLDSYLGRQTLDEIDNRFKDTRSFQRPRLPRRSARRASRARAIAAA